MTRRIRARALRRRGFTLLEVMVAVAILAVALTSIFSSEAGAIRAGLRARQTDVATLLARCKMAELEESTISKGLPEVNDHGEDACCDGAEVDGFQCEWSIDRIVLPDDGGLQDDETSEDDATSADALAQGERPNVDDLLSSTGGGGVSGDMVMQIAFPVVKPVIEEQVRRARVTVRWHEGSSEREFEVTQFLVRDSPANAPADDGSASSSSSGGSGTGSSGAGSSGPGSTSNSGAGFLR